MEKEERVIAAAYGWQLSVLPRSSALCFVVGNVAATTTRPFPHGRWVHFAAVLDKVHKESLLRIPYCM